MTKLLAAALLAIASTASATSYVASDATPQPQARRVDGRLGALLGGADVGDVSGFSAGLSGSVGVHFGDLSLRGLADYYKVADSGDAAHHRHGRGLRAGLALRYAFASTSPERALDATFWGELGGGFEHIAWLAGGVLDRPDAELAFGVDLGHRGDPDRRGRRSEVGYFMALRAMVGDAPDTGAMPTCGGPCTRATPPPRTDLTMFFELGVHWGR